jgi:hypothetical protein
MVRTKVLLRSFLFLPLVVLLSGAEPVPSPPKKVAEAQTTIRTWLDELVDKSEADVIKLLGKPTQRKTLEINGAERLALEYTTEGKCTLLLIFGEKRVSTVSMQLLSK